MTDKLFRFSEKTVKVFFSVFVVLFALTNILFTVHTNNLESNNVEYRFGLTLINIIVTVVYLLALIVFAKKDFFRIKENTLFIIFLSVCFVTGMAWIFTNDIVLREYDDAYNVFNAAVKINNGNFDPLGFHTYLSVYPNNIGILTYFLIHIKLFGETLSLYTIRIVNLLFVLGGYFCIYKISDVLFKRNRTVNLITIVLMFFSMQFVFYCFFVYGNCISYCLSLLSVLMLICYLKDRKIWKLSVMAIAIIVSIAIKMNSMIILVAEAIYLLLDLLKNKKAVVIFALVVMLVGSYIGTTGLQKYWAGKAEVDYDNTKLPTICWIAYGVNYGNNNPGFYFNDLEKFHFETEQVAEFTSVRAKEFIAGSIGEFKENPAKAIRFYVHKFMVSWGNPQYDAFGQYRELINSDFNSNVIAGNINACLELLWDANLTVISVALIIYLIKKKDKSLNELLPAVVIIGGFMFHSFWEVKSIYTYQYYLFVLPYAAAGTKELITNIKKKVV